MGWKFNPLFGTGLTPTGGGTPGDGIMADGSVPFTGDQSMGGNQLTNVGAPDSGDDATNRTYVDAAVATAANRTLSNLTSPTNINQDFIFDTGAAANIQTKNEATTTQGIQISSGTATGVGNASGHVGISTGSADADEDTGTIGIGTADATGTGNSGPLFVTTGEVEDGNSGPMDHSTGGSITGNSGNHTITTGNAGGDSGNIILTIGTGGGTNGSITLVDGSEGTAGDVWTSTDTLGSGAWITPTTGANTALSNLTTTAINANLLPDTTSTYDLGSAAKKWKNVFANVQVASPFFAINEINNGNSIGYLKEDDATIDAEIALVHTDNSTNSHTYGIAVGTSSKTSATNSRSILIRSGHTEGGDSGNVDISTGNSTTTGDSGNLSLATGTSTGGIRGEIRLVDGSEGTAGHVWTSTDTTGGGEWAAPSSGFDVLVFTSIATVGGAASEALTVTGLLATDTILAVTQKTGGGSALPLLAWSTQVDNGITGIWSADPGSAAVLLVAVKR